MSKRMLSFAGRRVTIVSIFVAGAALSGWGIVGATSTTSSANTFYGCVKSGLLSGITLNKAPKCSGGSLKVAWNERGQHGIQGIPGVKGDQGIQGVTGAKGDQGIQGVTGAKGDQGIQGVTGAKGDQGIQGVTGAKGDAGAAGTNGITDVWAVTGSSGYGCFYSCQNFAPTLASFILPAGSYLLDTHFSITTGTYAAAGQHCFVGSYSNGNWTSYDSNFNLSVPASSVGAVSDSTTFSLSGQTTVSAACWETFTLNSLNASVSMTAAAVTNLH